MSCISDISAEDASHALANAFYNQIHGFDGDVKSDIVEAMVSVVSSISEAELRDLALRLVEYIATDGTEF